jgi:probable rRNA maturation factor
MNEHSQIELYVTVGDDQQNATIEQLLASAPVDNVVQQTLDMVHITQPVMLTLLVTDDTGIRDMNKQYRAQDKATDVLSFPLLEQPLVNAPAEQLWTPAETEDNGKSKAQTPAFVTPPDADAVTNLGDVIMSWPTLMRQATEASHSPVYELLYLLSHGVLHLVGYDDASEAGYQAMVGIQQAVLQAVGQKA